jgi:hypothetical protein
MKIFVQLGLIFLTFIGSANAGIKEGVIAFHQGDHVGAFNEWAPLYEQGDVEATFRMALLYYYGRVVDQDFKKVVDLVFEAANAGSANAQLAVAIANEFNVVEAPDQELARAWANQPVDKLDLDVMVEVGWVYQYYGKPNKGGDYLIAAAERGGVVVTREIGWRYYNADSLVNAIKWLNKAIEMGDAESLYWMGKVFEKDGSMYQAIDWWKKGVELGESNSQAALGIAYFTGKGASLNKKKGLDLLQKAARQGNQKAAQLLATQ